MTNETDMRTYSFEIGKRYESYEEAVECPPNETYSDKSNETFSLIIPAYNEEKRIGPFLERIKSDLPADWEIIVISDGDDKTADIARSFDNRFKVYEYKNKLGKGGAIIEGFKRSNGDIVGYVDADGALNVTEILKVFHSVNTISPVAIGSRWVKGSRITTKQPFIRIILGRFYHYATFALLGLRQKDTQCGLKAYHISVLKEIIERLTLRNLSIDTAMLYHCKLLNYKIIEVPVIWNDVGGSKFHPVKAAVVMFATLLGLRLSHATKSKKIKQKLVDMHEILKGV